MTQTIIYSRASTPDGYTTYSAGGTSLMHYAKPAWAETATGAQTGSNIGAVGMRRIHEDYYKKKEVNDWLCNRSFTTYQLFVSWDTGTALPDTDTIDSASVSVWLSQNLSTASYFQVRATTDWGTLTTGDHLTSAGFAAKTLLASKYMPDMTSLAYVALTSETALLSALNKTGITYTVMCTNEYAAASDPAEPSDESCSVYNNSASHYPRLIINHTAPSGTPDSFKMVGLKFNSPNVIKVGA